jgi:hypothetical protein
MVSGHLHTPAALLQEKELAVLNILEAEWVLEPVWTMLGRETYLAPAENLTPVV